MISSCYLLPLPIHNFVTPPCTHSGNRQHPCCPRCCSPPSHTCYLLCTSPCSRSICPTKSSRYFCSDRCQAQLCFSLLLTHCPGAVSNCRSSACSVANHWYPAGFVTKRYTSRTSIFNTSWPRLAKMHISHPVLQPSSLPSMRAIATQPFCRLGENRMALEISSFNSICSSLVLTLSGRLSYLLDQIHGV